jgi:sugar lactone lactonase YvrE
MDEYDYDPRDPVPTLWSAAMFTGPADQRPLAERRDVLVYQSPPLEAHVEAIGYPEVTLWAASSCPDTDFFARLIDVAPDGRAIDVTAGMVRARHRHSLERAEFLTPNEPVEFRIRLRPTAHRFLPGHRIRLDVTSSDFPNYDRNHNTAADQNADAELVTAHQAVHHGGLQASQLVLPVMREKSAVPLWATGATKIPPPQFVLSFGTPGDGAGEFHSPIGIAIDAQDEIYVTEFHTHRVQVFDTSGRHLRMFAVDGQPGGIAVDQEGRVYVAPLLGHRIDVFDREGQALDSFGHQGNGDGEFDEPGGIAIGPDGTVYVVDQGNHRIQRFTPDGTFLGQWGQHGSAPGQFGGAGPAGSRLSGPQFAVFDADGHLWTTEGANLRVQEFDPAGKPLLAFAGEGEGPGCFGGRPADRTNPFEGPIGIAVDHMGRLWVSSTNNRVQCFARDGTFLTGIGDEGIEPGEFIIPHAMAFDSQGALYIVDASNQRVQKFAVP